MPTTYDVEIHDLEISRLFRISGGNVALYSRSLRRRVIAKATALAPVGVTIRRNPQVKLAESHRDGGALKAGPYRLRGIVSNVAPHAGYVAKGTLDKAPIISNKPGGMLSVPSRRGAATRVWRPFVMGQAPEGGTESNNWMMRAARQIVH